MNEDNAIIKAIDIDNQEDIIVTESGKGIEYNSILYELCYKRFDEVAAKKTYINIINHKKSMEKKLKRKISIVTAASDYNSSYPFFVEMRLIEKKLVEELSEIAIYDGLTGLYKRSVFDSLLNKEVDKHKRYGKSLCALMMDIDDFKLVNDTYGHQEGDRVLEEIGRLIIENSRLYDVECRYGGEELMIILPNTHKQEAFIIGERYRISIKSFFANRDYKITVSVGVAELSEGELAKDIIRNCDEALYTAKKSGKDQTCIYTSDEV